MRAEIVTVWRTTPARLREVADHLERMGEAMEVGDVAPSWDSDQGVIVRLDWNAFLDEGIEGAA